MPFLTARWSNLILANYEVDGEIFESRVPDGLELDTHEGRHFVSLVGFQFIDTRVLGIKWPGLHSFVELNLRFYVKRVMPNDEVRRGVVFVKEIVPSALIAFVARTLYHEPYERWSIDTIPDFSVDNRYGYAWQKNQQSHSIECTADATSQPLVERSHEQFIAEHYWGYTRLPSGGTNEYEVKHPSWTYRSVKDVDIRCDFQETYGASWAFLNMQTPYSVILADGSEISVSGKQHFAS